MDRTGYRKSPQLHRYWLEFEVAPPPPISPGVIQLGGAPMLWLFRCCGITAFTLDDAIWIWRAVVGADGDGVPLASVIIDVDITTVWNARPYGVLGNPAWRGMWHPVPVQPLGRGSEFAAQLAAYLWTKAKRRARLRQG